MLHVGPLQHHGAVALLGASIDYGGFLGSDKVEDGIRIQVVGVNLYYAVGSRNERPGKTGFARAPDPRRFRS